jgi:hypothetical protein
LERRKYLWVKGIRNRNEVTAFMNHSQFKVACQKLRKKHTAVNLRTKAPKLAVSKFKKEPENAGRNL